MVFPENGLIKLDEYPRSLIANELAEEIPDPNKGTYNPCENPLEYMTRIKTYRLSCLAKTNNLYIVADYSDRVPCVNTTDPNCPNDGLYLFNTAVVFAPDGSLVAKYHKMQLFFELYYNVPPDPQFVYFDTPFGRMGLFICFDILYRNPGIQLISEYGVQTMLYPTWWYDELPYRTAQQIQEGWAVTNRVNLLGANMHIHRLGSTGSGIYSGKSGQIIVSDILEKSPHLLIADIPIDSRNNGANCLSHSFRKTIRFTEFVDDSEYEVSHKLDLKDSVLFKLTQSEDSINLCDNSLCCHLSYTLKSENFFKDESFWFIVTNRSAESRTGSRYPICEEICGIFRCDDDECQTISKETKKTVFNTLEIRANMSTTYVYPSATTNSLKLLPKNNWIYENDEQLGSEVKLRLNDFNEPLLSINLYGRCYDRDPPYKQ